MCFLLKDCVGKGGGRFISCLILHAQVNYFLYSTSSVVSQTEMRHHSPETTYEQAFSGEQPNLGSKRKTLSQKWGSLFSTRWFAKFGKNQTKALKERERQKICFL